MERVPTTPTMLCSICVITAIRGLSDPYVLVAENHGFSVLQSFSFGAIRMSGCGLALFYSICIIAATVNERGFVNLGACTQSHDRVSETERFFLLFTGGVLSAQG